MYLLALAFLVAGVYSAWAGDVSNARPIIGAAVVLAGARFILGPQEEASAVRKMGSWVGVLILVGASMYLIQAIFA